MVPWHLERNPLAPGVPLEGTDTVEGLRTLERLRLAELLQQGPGSSSGGANTGSGSRAGGGQTGRGRQRTFQRYRGPFIEQLTTEDLKQDPKSWPVFWKGSERGNAADAYNLPSSLAVLHERTEENFVTFLPNYLRLAGAVFLATFYLRPKALLGAAAVSFSMYRSMGQALERQRQEQAIAAAGEALARRRQQQPGTARADPNEKAVTGLVTVVTWLLVAYTRCLPMLLLGAVNSLLAVLLHCGLRRAPSEYRAKGRQLLGFTWRQLLGREPVAEGADPWALFRQIATAGLDSAALWLRRSYLYCKFYGTALLDRLTHPRPR